MSRIPSHILAKAAAAGGGAAEAASSPHASQSDAVLQVISKPLAFLHQEFPQLKEPSVAVWSKWLGIGTKNLCNWREQITEYNETFKSEAAPNKVATTSSVDEEGRRVNTSGPHPAPPKEGPGSDWSLLKWGSKRGCILSPATELLDAPIVGGSTFVANRDVPSGMFVLSVPRSRCIEVPEPTFAYPEGQVPAYIAQLEELIFRVLRSVAIESDPHHDYGCYLRFSQPPPRNLPFLKQSALGTDLGKELWAEFNKAAAAPYHPKMKGVPEDEYRWAASMALSRRCFGTMIHPWADKLNHGASANTYSTFADSSLTGVDVMDNLYAGVPEAELFTPFLHCTTLSKVKRGEAFVMSYSDQDPQAQTEASGGSDGRDAWLSNWGMVPKTKNLIDHEGLKQTAVMLTKHRVYNRKRLFPKRPEELTEAEKLAMQQDEAKRGEASKKPAPVSPPQSA